jgi:hypothetical protein
MSKRASVASNSITEKPRRKNDWYATPRKAVEPLVAHLPEYASFCEPCAGDGALIRHIVELTDDSIWPKLWFDIEPKSADVYVGNALELNAEKLLGVDLIITNPPFKWDMLQPMLDHLPELKPTWLLLPFGYAANKRMAPYMKICRKVQPIGRVKWIEDSKHSSTEDHAWFLFDSDFTGTTKLYPRT